LLDGFARHEIGRGFGKPGYRHYFFEVSGNDLIALFRVAEVEPLAEKEHGYPTAGPFIFDHVSFGVETEETLWELKDRLNAAGFWVSKVIDHGFISTSIVDIDLMSGLDMMDSK
jgi:hypothetical protein